MTSRPENPRSVSSLLLPLISSLPDQNSALSMSVSPCAMASRTSVPLTEKPAPLETVLPPCIVEMPVIVPCHGSVKPAAAVNENEAFTFGGSPSIAAGSRTE